MYSTCRHARRASRMAFTLTDLAASLAALVLLAAIALPYVGHTREQARMVACASNLRQMGVILQKYAQAHGDYIYYQYPGAPPATERTDIYRKHPSRCSGITSWKTMLPRLDELGYGEATKYGFCPAGVDEEGYRWGVSDEYGEPHRGNYLYLGPGTYGTFWVPHIMSPRLVHREQGEYRWHDANKRHIREWCGVHADGTVGMPFEPNGPQKWSGTRVPIMGEASLESKDKLRAAPHMPRYKKPEDYAESGGNMNYLFTDGSVVTYPFSL